MLIARGPLMEHTSCMASNDSGTARLTDNGVECPLCGGTGWKMVDVVDQFGRNSQKATKCDCQHRIHGERLLANARIPRRYEHCTLANFEFDGKTQRSLASAKLKAGAFVEEYPVQRAGLLFIGPVGTGKTHLAVGILKELIVQKNIACVFYEYGELLKTIQNSYNPTVQMTEMDVLRPIFATEVLVLDELGGMRTTDWVEETVSHILNTRYNEEKTTIITTNHPDLPPSNTPEGEALKKAAGYNAQTITLGDRLKERMRSRLHEMCRIVDVIGPDFRLTRRASFFDSVPEGKR